MPDVFNILFLLLVIMPFLLAVIALSIVVFRRKKQDRKSLQNLISNYKEKEEGRKQSVLEFLKNKVGIEDPEREEMSQKILQARKSFLQKIISSFLTREQEAISNLDNDLSVISQAYQELSISMSAQDEAIVADSDMTESLAKLKKENKNLKIEVHTTLSTLNSIFAEYTSMFGEETDRKDMSVDEILEAMESFGTEDVKKEDTTVISDDLGDDNDDPEEDDDENIDDIEPEWGNAIEEEDDESDSVDKNK